MNFTEIAEARQSCRRFDAQRQVEREKLEAVLNAARLAPSACNGQPYHMTLCSGTVARRVAMATTGMGMNKFTADAPVMLVIAEAPYVATAAFGAKVKGNDYRSIDIGILSAYVTAEATCQGLGSCILGWLDDKEIRAATGETGTVRLVIALGYPAAEDSLRPKKRKSIEVLVKEMDD